MNVQALHCPNQIVLKNEHGMCLHTMHDRVEAFKELMHRAIRNKGTWRLSYSPEYRVYIAGGLNRPNYTGFHPIATCEFRGLKYPVRVKLLQRGRQ